MKREGGPGGPMVGVSASHREGPVICPQPVYKRYCAEKFRLKITGSPECTGTDVLVNLWSPKSRRCVHRREPGATVMNYFFLKISDYFTGEYRILTGIYRI